MNNDGSKSKMSENTMGHPTSQSRQPPFQQCQRDEWNGYYKRILSYVFLSRFIPRINLTFLCFLVIIFFIFEVQFLWQILIEEERKKMITFFSWCLQKRINPFSQSTSSFVQSRSSGESHDYVYSSLLACWCDEIIIKKLWLWDYMMGVS